MSVVTAPSTEQMTASIATAYRDGLSIHAGTSHLATVIGVELSADTLDAIEQAGRQARRTLTRAQAAAIDVALTDDHLVEQTRIAQQRSCRDQ